MKSARSLVFTLIITLLVVGAAFYSSCTKDACKGVTCLNGVLCNGGTCACPAGIGGIRCETVYRKQYSNTYTGRAIYTSTDTSNATHSDSLSQLVFYAGTDTTYTLMQLTWNSNGAKVFTTPINITNYQSSGSNFVVPNITVDTVVYSGSGTVNGNSASITLTRKYKHIPSDNITLSNFAKQQ